MYQKDNPKMRLKTIEKDNLKNHFSFYNYSDLQIYCTNKDNPKMLKYIKKKDSLNVIIKLVINIIYYLIITYYIYTNNIMYNSNNINYQINTIGMCMNY